MALLKDVIASYPRVAEFLKLFDLKLPLIQAPMAGADNNALAIAVAKMGGLGSRGLGYTSVDQIKATIADLKQHTKHYQINIFVPLAELSAFSQTEFERHAQHLQDYLQPYYKQLGLTPGPFVYRDLQQLFAAQLQVLIDEAVPCVSFAFGQLTADMIAQFHRLGSKVIGTATTCDEAHILAALGCDAIVIQGLEAGGHRGGFLANDLSGQQPLMSLLTTLKHELSVPLIAAGGLRHHEQVLACFEAGASAIQMGTALLACEDCTAIPRSYRDLLHHTSVDDIQITQAISGRNAQAIHNKLFELMQTYDDMYPKYRLPYPIPHLITAPIRAAASSSNDASWIAAWSGKSAVPLQLVTINELLAELFPIS